MTRGSSGEAPSTPLLDPLLPLLAPGLVGALPLILCVNGAGKDFFLSMFWTVLSKRRKMDSARVRMGISSIEFESSLTVIALAPLSHLKRRKGEGKKERRTVFQNLVKLLQMIHNHIPVLLQDTNGNK